MHATENHAHHPTHYYRNLNAFIIFKNKYLLFIIFISTLSLPYIVRFHLTYKIYRLRCTQTNKYYSNDSCHVALRITFKFKSQRKYYPSISVKFVFYLILLFIYPKICTRPPALYHQSYRPRSGRIQICRFC